MTSCHRSTHQPPSGPRARRSFFSLGTKAPGFYIAASRRTGRSNFSDLAGKPVILAFYPADWSPVCGDQLAALQ